MLMKTKKEPIGIERIAAVHFFLHDLNRTCDHYVNVLDFQEVAVSTPAFEIEHHARASVVEAGDVRFVLFEATEPRGETHQWLQRHPEGVGRVVFDVTDAERAFALLTERGATPVSGIQRRVVEGGLVSWFDIATAFGDTLFRFVQHEGRTPIMPNLQRLDTTGHVSNRFGITHIDHVTTNFLTMQPALAWMEQVMGFERFWNIDFHTQDVDRGNVHGSGLKSIVMHDPYSGLKFANNEPAQPNFHSSQIYLFYVDHRGAGIQHLALGVTDLIGAVNGMRERGGQFMPTPKTYYDMLPERLREIGVNHLEEELDVLRDMQILVDGQADRSYLLQIFMKEASGIFHDAEAGPVFIELLQRKGDLGFGGGNFRALFESIERQQQVEGRVPA